MSMEQEKGFTGTSTVGEDQSYLASYPPDALQRAHGIVKSNDRINLFKIAQHYPIPAGAMLGL